MDIQTIGQLVSTVGFPIAIVCYLLYYQKDTTDRLVGIISENTKAIELLQHEIHEYFVKKDKNDA